MTKRRLNPLAWLALRTKVDCIRNRAWSKAAPQAYPFNPSSSAIRIVVGGDMSFDNELRIVSHLGAYALRKPWEPVIEMNTNQTIVRRPQTKRAGIIASLKRKASSRLLEIYKRHMFLDAFRPPDRNSWEVYREIVHKNNAVPGQIMIPEVYGKMFRFNVPDETNGRNFDFPFLKLTPFLKQRDFVLMNLETPLTEHPRPYGFIVSRSGYVKALRNAGISMVNLANNHMFDAGEIGFLDTMRHLDQEGIPYIGAANTLDDARLGRIEVIGGIRIGFLGYTQWCNMNYASIAADYPGLLPMDRKIMMEDIEVLKKKADLVFVSLHWGTQFEPTPYPQQTELAHLLIDRGADAIIGHHGHVPQAIEVYRGRPIIYCLGNLIFGWGEVRWVSDNYLAEIVLDRNGIQGVVIYPVSGINEELLQPEILKGPRAEALLRALQIKSAYFGTGIHIQEDKGFVNTRAVTEKHRQVHNG